MNVGRVNARGRAIVKARRDEVENAGDRGAIPLDASASGRRTAEVAIAGFWERWSRDLYCDKENLRAEVKRIVKLFLRVAYDAGLRQASLAQLERHTKVAFCVR